VAPSTPRAKSRAPSLAGIVSISKECIAAGNDAVAQFFPTIRSAVPSFPEPVGRTACELGLIDAIPAVAAAFPALATECVALLTVVSRQPEILAYLKTNEVELYGALEQAVLRVTPGLQRAKALIELATLFHAEGDEVPVVRHVRAVERLLEYPDAEAFIATELGRLASLRANAIALATAEILALIVDRIAAVQNDEALRLAYFGSLRLLSANNFVFPTFAKTARLAASDSFLFPHEFAGLYLELLAAKPEPGAHGQSTIHDSLATEAGLRTILSLLRRLAGPSLSDAHGCLLLARTLRLLRRAIERDTLEQTFFVMDGFSLLAASLSAARKEFFTDELMKALLPLYEVLTLAPLQVTMVECVWLNLELAAKFGSAHEVFFSVLALAHQSKPAPFESRAVFARFVYQGLVAAQSPPSDWMWALVESFLTGKVGAAGFIVLVPASLACEAPGSAQRILQIIKNYLDKRPVPIAAEIHPLLIELLRRLNLQELALAILDKIEELAVLAPLLVKAPAVIAWDNAPALVPRFRELLYTARGWLYLPLFTACALRVGSADRRSLADELIGRIRNAPAEFVMFTSVRFWYARLFELFCAANIGQDRVGGVFADLIDASLDAPQHAEMRGAFFAFLAASEAHRPLRRCVFVHVLRPEVMSPARFAALFDPVFDYLFVQFGGTDRLHIAVDLDAGGCWRDADIAAALMGGFEPLQPFHNIQKAAYVVGHLWRAGHLGFVAKIGTLKATAEVVYTAFALVAHVAAPTVVFDDYVPQFDDSEDSDALQFFNFEMGIHAKLPAVTRSLADAAALLAREDAVAQESAAADAVAAAQRLQQWRDDQRTKAENERDGRRRLWEQFSASLSETIGLSE
jgi:hypothetical protein